MILNVPKQHEDHAGSRRGCPGQSSIPTYVVEAFWPYISLESKCCRSDKELNWPQSFPIQPLMHSSLYMGCSGSQAIPRTLRRALPSIQSCLRKKKRPSGPTHGRPTRTAAKHALWHVDVVVLTCGVLVSLLDWRSCTCILASAY